MAEFNALVTDTHPLLFHGAGGGRLGPRAAAHFNACDRLEAIVYVPVVVIWETCLLAHVGKINLKRSPQTFFEELFRSSAYQPLDLTPEQTYLADQLRPNKDLFDALICAAAKFLELPLLTRDSAITESGLDVVW